MGKGGVKFNLVTLTFYDRSPEIYYSIAIGEEKDVKPLPPVPFYVMHAQGAGDSLYTDKLPR